MNLDKARWAIGARVLRILGLPALTYEGVLARHELARIMTLIDRERHKYMPWLANATGMPALPRVRVMELSLIHISEPTRPY